MRELGGRGKQGRKRSGRLLGAGAALLALTAGASRAADQWSAYGHDETGQRYSPLSQINRANVSRLQVAWTFHTGDIADRTKGPRSGFETTPLYVDGRLFLTTPFNRVIALDPITGKQVWTYDPLVDRGLAYGDGLINRGVATWIDPRQPAAGACRRRLFEATLDARLIALDARTGRPCADFGSAGQVSLRDAPNYVPGWYHETSPPAVIDDVVVVGSAIDDNGRAEMPDGVVRAYDVRTGALRWSWQPLVPAPNTKTGAGNAWSVMATDPERHLVFVPTGSASPDYYGGLRPGDDRWADSVVALDSRTGKLAWGFQLVHHDLWDYDTAAPVMLADIPHDGRTTPVVIAGNKTGMVYVLGRADGHPVFAVTERPVPQSDVPGEMTSPTQPFSSLPAVAPQSIDPADAWGPTPADKAACRAQLEALTGHSVFSPPSLKGTLAIPGNVGGINWSGYAYDKAHDLLIVSATNLPYKVRLIPRDDFPAAVRGATNRRAGFGAQVGTPYGLERTMLFGPSNLPCVPPPWGSLSAIDLKTGTLRWTSPLGSLREIGAPDEPTGSLILGGPMVTAGGLIFSAGTLDRRLHAFDVETGKEVWTAELPTSAHAMPMTYEAGGRQYLVIAAGGSPNVSEERPGDALVAFVLPGRSGK
jgi:quinoprotein glucose dehydrogenase